MIPGSAEYALNLVDLAQRRVRDAMVPWSQTVKADALMSPQSIGSWRFSSGHTRLPVVNVAMVTGLNGAPLGIVTVEDILEEVLGDLYDEDDDQAVAKLLAARGKLKGAASPVRP
jgi:CBS domain containing-hemolysin-like protein